MPPMLSHSSHWGAFYARPGNGIVIVEPHPDDPSPSPLLANIPASARHESRVRAPMFRRRWLENGPGPDRRGDDAFVEVDWAQAAGLIARELTRVRNRYSPSAIFGGSYGWASAGRFHHAQSQIHRFLNLCVGGYTRSVNSYSAGAAAVIMPHIIGPFERLYRETIRWDDVINHTEIVVAFGGMALKNSMIAPGGVGAHVVHGAMRAASARGCKFVLVGPLRDDLPPDIGMRWIPIRPGTDVALMLAMIHWLIEGGSADRDFLNACCVGFGALEHYVLGHVDSVVKDAEWASPICGIPASEIRALAESLIGRRVLITTSQSLQRAEHGEQPIWTAVALAATLGQIGLQGGGYAYGLGSMGNIGKDSLKVKLPSLPQGNNAVDAFIPVARIADMLLHPGESYSYNGAKHTYPDIRLLYWGGGNPFHHHQDLLRLRTAFDRPDTVVVHEPFWTATAQHADIVLPSTITLERNDIGAAANDRLVVAMKKIIEPYAASKSDYEIFAMIARELGSELAFTEGRTEQDWLHELFGVIRRGLDANGYPAPTFEQFWQDGEMLLPTTEREPDFLQQFRRDPENARLSTPSGKIELFSEAIAGFGYEDCRGHPMWYVADESPLGPAAHLFPLQLVANQPETRLHSQLDFGTTSQEGKLRGLERIRLHPADARPRSISDGDIVRVFNDRGSVLAAARISDALMAGVVQLATGAWFKPFVDRNLGTICGAGNPNMLTRDVGTSSLAQGCTGQLAMVEIENYQGPGADQEGRPDCTAREA